VLGCRAPSAHGLTTGTEAGRRAAYPRIVESQDFQFRLNEIVITHIKVRGVVIGASTDGWELAACDEKLGKFAIDDNEELDDPALKGVPLS